MDATAWRVEDPTGARKWAVLNPANMHVDLLDDNGMEYSLFLASGLETRRGRTLGTRRRRRRSPAPASAPALNAFAPDATLDAIEAMLPTMFTSAKFPIAHFARSPLGIGVCHPHMWRGIREHVPSPSGQRAVTSTRQGLRRLLVRLREVFDVVEPSVANAPVYGHAMRSLMIEACTELESNFKAIMRANGGTGEATKDYVRLLGPLRLAEWKIGLSHYPDFPAVAPFSSWTAKDPTKSLAWYRAYNGVKHDRDTNFAQGTLSHAFDAVAACFIIALSQFGSDAVGDDVFSDFTTVNAPIWSITEEYAPPWIGPAARAAHSWVDTWSFAVATL